MTILLLGGKGKTSSRLAFLLNKAQVPFVLASRSISNTCPYQQVIFNWLEETTYNDLFTSVAHIHAVYLVAPPVLDMFPPMKKFIDIAKSNGVERFVLLSASALEPGGYAMGQAHEYLMSLGVDYAVLRPTWFMENFSEQQHLMTIRDENKMYSATADGKVSWVSAEDIAAVGFRCLVDDESHNTDHIIRGPDLLSYDDVAGELSRLLNRKITHTKMSTNQLSDRFVASGMPKDYADMLSGLDEAVANGSEEMLNDEVLKVTGSQPKSFKTFAVENLNKWK